MDTSTPGRPQSLMASAVAALHGIRRPTDPLALQDPASEAHHHLHIQPIRSAQSAAATAAVMAEVRPSDQQVPAPNPHQYREPDRSLPSSPAAAASEAASREIRFISHNEVVDQERGSRDTLLRFEVGVRSAEELLQVLGRRGGQIRVGASSSRIQHNRRTLGPDSTIAYHYQS